MLRLLLLALAAILQAPCAEAAAVALRGPASSAFRFVPPGGTLDQAELAVNRASGLHSSIPSTIVMMVFLILLLVAYLRLPYKGYVETLLQRISKARLEVEKEKCRQRFRKECDAIFDKANNAGGTGIPDSKF